jgi:hypothetical protein
MGTTKEVSESRLSGAPAIRGLLTLSWAPNAGGVATVAFRLGGHRAGLTDPAVAGPAIGNQVQLCCGEKEIVITQLCCGARSKVDPGETAQVSASVKLGNPLKSLEEVGLTVNEFMLELNDSDKPFRVEPAGSVFVRVMVWDTGLDPTSWAGNPSLAGDNESGCVQSFAFPSARQTLPNSPGAAVSMGLGQALVVTPYPARPCSTFPPEARLSNLTGERLPGVEDCAPERSAGINGLPIWPIFSPLSAMICKITEVPLI